MNEPSSIVAAATAESRLRRIVRLSLVAVPVLLLVVMTGGTALVASPPTGLDATFRLLWRLLDPPIHVLQVLLVISPLAIRAPSRRQAWLRCLLAGALAVLLDVDHLVAAGSPSLFAITHLAQRPVTHCLLLALAAGLATYWLTRKPPLAWIAFAALAAHVLYDASSGGTPFLWPLPALSLPAPLAYAAILGLHLATQALAALAPAAGVATLRGWRSLAPGWWLALWR